MKHMKQFTSFVLIVLLVAALLPIFAESTEVKTNYIMEEMLIWAIQDEVNAEAIYQSVLDKFGQDLRPFSAIVKAERTHQSLLMPLLEKYSLEKPEPAEFEVPETFQDALMAGVEAEKINIAMYEQFLNREDLPEEIVTVFERLAAASRNHLEAFSRRVSRNHGEGWRNANPQRRNNRRP
jgi:hypothetical protein